MAINFDTAPDVKPAQGADIPKGTYLAKIEAAEMKQPQDQSKPQYLSITLAITDPESNTPLGKLWDIMTESTNSYVQYKAKRLVKACGLKLSGEVELSDIGKLIVGKDIKVDITIQEDKKVDPPVKRSVVDIFSADIFYPLVEESMDEFVLEPEGTDTPAPAPVTPAEY